MGIQSRAFRLVAPQQAKAVASAILRLLEGEGVVTPEGRTLPTCHTYEQLASMIGANRESTTRALRRLREVGAVEVEGRRIRVADLEALRQAAEER